MRIGILGGTFNPIHDVHILMAQMSKKAATLDKVLFMPSKSPAYKDGSVILSFEERFKMVQEAVSERLPDGYEVSDFENLREGNTYTYETLELLTKANPKDEFFFIIGGDSLVYFDTWKNPEIISKLCTLVVCNRGGYEEKELSDKAEELFKRFGTKIIFVEGFPKYDYSSTTVREEIKVGKLWTTHIPNSVKTHIYRHDLYERERGIVTFSPELISIIISSIKERLDDYRFIHSLGVGYMAADVALFYGIPQDKALVAGLLHDVAKGLSHKEQYEMCLEKGVSLLPSEIEIQGLIHGRLGAYIAEHEFKISEPDVLSAISYHTLGKPQMSMLEKIIFAVDFIEPHRDYYSNPDLPTLRKLIFTDIDKTIYLILKNQQRYFKDRNAKVAPEFYDTFGYFTRLIEERN